MSNPAPRVSSLLNGIKPNAHVMFHLQGQIGDIAMLARGDMAVSFRSVEPFGAVQSQRLDLQLARAVQHASMHRTTHDTICADFMPPSRTT